LSKNINIKIAQGNDDIITIESLADEIWTQHYEPIIGIKQVDYMLGKYQSYKAILHQMAEGYAYYISKYDEVPCGYCSIKIDNGIFLSKFYVKQSHRGLGLGRAMIETIMEYAATHKEKRIWLTCNKHNSNTLAAYKKLGFNIIDDVVTDIGNGFVMDDYVLEKRL